MGGSVEVKSELGKGSEFILNIRTKCKVKKIDKSKAMIKSSNPNVKKSSDKKINPKVLKRLKSSSQQATGVIQNAVFINHNIEEN